MPTVITMPICDRPPAPEPVATASGTAPSTVATVVITIGRSRIAAASRIASLKSLPASRNWLANSTIRMPCLAISPTSATRPITL